MRPSCKVTTTTNERLVLKICFFFGGCVAFTVASPLAQETASAPESSFLDYLSVSALAKQSQSKLQSQLRVQISAVAVQFYSLFFSSC